MNSVRICIAAIAACSAGVPLGAMADSPAPATSTAPGLEDLLTAAGINVSGYVGASYYHSSGYNSFHQFDVHHDTFQLDQAGLSVAHQPKQGFGGLVDLITGEDARI